MFGVSQIPGYKTLNPCNVFHQAIVVYFDFKCVNVEKYNYF